MKSLIHYFIIIVVIIICSDIQGLTFKMPALECFAITNRFPTAYKILSVIDYCHYYYVNVRFSSGGCYTDITPKEWAIANGQRSFVSFLLLQLYNSFLRILAVPNKAVFCNSPVIIITVVIIIIIIIINSWAIIIII